MTRNGRFGTVRGCLAAVPSVWVGMAELMLAMLTIASGFLAARVVTDTLPIMVASVVRYALAALLLLPFSLFRGPLPRPTPSTWRLLIGVALGGTLVFNVGLLYGLRMTSVVEAGIITSSTPVLVGLIGLLLFRERISRQSWLGIVAAMIGVLLVVAEPTEVDGASTSGGARLGGLLLILLAASGEATFNVLGRRLPRSLPSVTASALTMAIAVILFLPGAVIQVVANASIPSNPHGWTAVLFLAAIPSALGLLLWAGRRAACVPRRRRGDDRADTGVHDGPGGAGPG